MTEKVMNAGKDGIYVFKVHSEATKLDVCKAVEKVFSVKVSKVNMLNRDGKRKKFRGKDGLTKPRKLAIVRLADGSINFEDGI